MYEIIKHRIVNDCHVALQCQNFLKSYTKNSQPSFNCRSFRKSKNSVQKFPMQE